MRKIIHIDMDCFFAAIEIREQPALKGRPVAVGGASGRGVLTTCNYAARKFGCRSAMPTYKALQRCPDLVLLPVRFELYRKESRRIRNILLRYTPLLEPLSLDEAYLDVTASPRYGWDLAREMRAEIAEATGLTASAGIAPNKLLAKIASDWRKPNGQYAVLPSKVASFMKELPVRKIWGIGPKNAEILKRNGIETCGQMQQLSVTQLHRFFGKFGGELFRLCRGEDHRPVEPHRLRKSISTEQTFENNLDTFEECLEKLTLIHAELIEDLRTKAGPRVIRKAFVKLKFADFRQTTRECLCKEPGFPVFRDLLADAHARSSQKVRLLGAGVRFLEEEGEKTDSMQMELSFTPPIQSCPASPPLPGNPVPMKSREKVCFKGEKQKTPLWLWPNILSLDVAFIAVFWQGIFARAFSIPLHLHHRVVLGLSAWLVYSADRWLDGWKTIAPLQSLAARHRFYILLRWQVFSIWVLVLTLAFFLAWNRLRPIEFLNGCALLGLCLLYTLAVQTGRFHEQSFLPKEFYVSLLFSGGVFLFIIDKITPMRHPFPGVFFAFLALCFSNCCLISRREKRTDALNNQPSIARRWPAFSLQTPFFLTVAAALPLLLYAISPTPRLFSLPLAFSLSALGLFLLEKKGGDLTPEPFHVLSDLALLLPALLTTLLGPNFL